MSLILALAAAAAAPHPAPLKTFKDWIVGCDNGRACHATSLVPADGDETWTILSVGRAAGALAPPTLSLAGGDVRARLVLDGKPLGARLRQGADGVGLEAGDVSQVLAALRNGSVLEIETADAKMSSKASLAGLSAALLYMDEQQKRIGTVTALVKRGPAPAASVPPAPLLPVIREVRPSASARAIALPAGRIAAWRKRAECDPDLPVDGQSVEAHPLDTKTTLFLVRCWQGAYNTTSLTLLARERDGSDLAPARFDFNASAGEDSGERVPPDGAYWDDETKRLASYFKGRGLGDCGNAQQWAWDGQRFRLIREETMGECRGSTDYITTWRAGVRR